MIQEVLKLACQAWFGMFTLLALISTWIACSATSTLARMPIASKQEWCCRLCHYLFKWVIVKPCPWIRISTPPADEVARLLDRERVCLLMNHTSFFDTVLFVATTPPDIIGRYRTLMKAGLFDVPFLAGICRMVGHFPVFFKSQDENSFGVDKQEQEKITEKVRAHVEANGSLCVFPEGKINRNPAILCPFRRGLFTIVEEMNMAVVTMTSVGNNETWPRHNQVGGLPARVTMKLTEVAGAGHSLTSAAIQEKAQAAMQADLTYLMRQRNGSNSKES